MAENLEEVAIVGTAIRCPGANNNDEFWRVLVEGECHIGRVPKERWDVNDTNIKDSDTTWKSCAEHAGLISEPYKWDNRHFGISETEAGWMNPQQCLALEVTKLALENAGFTRQMMNESNTGVYIGAMNDDLLFGVYNARNECNNFLVTGMAPSIISNRISFHYNLQGPSLTLDTACSSSMVAIHLASQAIRTGECDMAICGGVNSILSPFNFVSLNKAKMISPTGKSHVFCEDADGYVRGEGCGIVILKRLKKAIENGDHVYGLIATGCNQDGHPDPNSPITAPSAKQQLQLIQTMYQKYNQDPCLVQYIEAHGTGTPVGDPIEVRALAEFFGKHLEKNKIIQIGSVKTNIGHLESAAGVAGLIKSILMIENRKIVPSLHFTEGNSNIKIPLKVATVVKDWHPNEDGTRVACVNSFGFGGTNCHALIRQYNITRKARHTRKRNLRYYVISISGTSVKSVKNSVMYLQQCIRQKKYKISDLSYTSLLRRDHYRYRKAYVASNCIDLSSDIDQYQSSLDKIAAVDTRESNLIFLFCGVGTIWRGTCKEMLNSNAVFEAKFKEIDQELKTYTKFSIIEEVRNPSNDLPVNSFKGPLIIFACQIALFDTWVELGIRPNTIIGQSVGEVAAAYAAGCLTFENAVKVIYHRTHLSSNVKGGEMLIIFYSDIEAIKGICNQSNGKVDIAVYSSNEACVVSGDGDAIRQLKELMIKSRNMKMPVFKKLEVGCAYHSFHMDKVSNDLEYKLADLTGETPYHDLRLVSTVTGSPLNGKEMSTPSYWSRNLREPVQLAKAIKESILPKKSNVILEIGPNPVIKTHLKFITNEQSTLIASMSQPNESKTFYRAMADLHQLGFTIDWKKVFDGTETLTDIPKYIFDRSANLIISDRLKEGLQSKPTNDDHSFIHLKPLSKEYLIEISTETTPYIYEHFVEGHIIAPGAIYGEIALKIGSEILKVPISSVNVSVEFVRPLVLSEMENIILQTTHKEYGSTFDIKRKTKVLCKVGIAKFAKQKPQRINILEVKKQYPKYKDSTELYKTLEELGFRYGSSLKVIGGSWVSETGYFSELKTNSDISDQFHCLNLHPIILDGAFQSIVLSYMPINRLNQTDLKERPIPFRLKSLTAHHSLEKNMFIVGRFVKSDSIRTIVDMIIVNENGDVLIEIEHFEAYNRGSKELQMNLDNKLYKTNWQLVLNETPEKKSLEADLLCLSISFSHEATLLLKHILPAHKRGIVCLPFNQEEYRPLNMFYDLQTFIEKKLKGFENLSRIIFFPGLDSLKMEEHSPEAIFNMIKTSCVFLTKLVQHLIQKECYIPIYVITKQTQPKASIESIKDTCVNLVGSELWGMSRCLLRERTFSQIYLIDLENDEGLESVPYLMLDKKDERLEYVQEFKVENGCIYISQIIRTTAPRTSIRMNSYNEHELLQIRSKHPERVENPFYRHVSQDVQEVPAEHVKLKVTSIFINNKWTPVTMTVEVDDPYPWSFREGEGHQILPCEVTGIVLPLATESSNLSSLDKTKHTELVTCFPNSCANKLVLPRNCTVDVSLIRNYRPGLLAESVMYLSILSETKANLPLDVVYDQEWTLDLNFFKNITKFYGYRLRSIFNIGKFNETDITDKCQVLILSRNVHLIEKAIKRVNTSNIFMLSFTHFVSKSTERRIRMACPQLDIMLVNSDHIRSHQQLANLLKKAQEWLKAIPSGIFTTEISFPNERLLISFLSAQKAVGNVINAHELKTATQRECLFSKNATYVVVGGLTGLGWEIVQIIAQMGGGGIAILARRSPDEEKQRQLEDLKLERNCTIEYIKADVSNFNCVKQAFVTIGEKFQNKSIKGIFNGAAVFDDAIILNMTEEKIDKVIRPKILCTWNLHLISRYLQLDYFVQHSSVSSIFGNSGQTNYGAGNSFKDTMTMYRRYLGLAGQTINWGSMKLGVLEYNLKTLKHLKAQGYIILLKNEVIECLLNALCTNDSQVICSGFDWTNIVKHSLDRKHLTSRLGPIIEIYIEIFTTKQANIKGVDLEKLLSLTAKEQMKTIVEIVSRVAADVCTVELSDVYPSTILADLGMDSMKGMSFIDAIHEHTQCVIQAVEVINPDSSIDTISNLVLDQLRSEKIDMGINH